MNKRNTLQKMVSLGSAVSNGMLLASVSYTLILSAAALFRGPLTTPTHIGQVSLFATILSLMSLAALYAAYKTGVNGIRAAFASETNASHSLCANSFLISFIATATTSFFSGVYHFGTSMVLGTLCFAILSFVFALISMEDSISIPA